MANMTGGGKKDAKSVSHKDPTFHSTGNSNRHKTASGGNGKKKG